MFGSLGYAAITAPLEMPPATELTPFDAEVAAQKTQAFAAYIGQPNIDPNQFSLFQLAGSEAPSPVVDLHTAAPTLKGSDDTPDVRVGIDLLSFRIAPEDGVDPTMQATLRLDMGKDRLSSSTLDPLFWSIAAGLDLAAQSVTAPADAKGLNADLSKAFKQRPIEIPGSLAELRVELIAHVEPPWWRRIFSFADSASVRKLVAAVGFPGIALDAVQLLDTMLGQFDQARAKPIFQSRPLTVALTEQAAKEFTGGLSSVSAAVLNDGVFLMLRHRDVPLLKVHPPIYLGGYGRLIPKASWDPTAPTLPDDDPYSSLSYAVLRVRTRAVRLDPSL
jgi:hypothetical protein